MIKEFSASIFSVVWGSEHLNKKFSINDETSHSTGTEESIMARIKICALMMTATALAMTYPSAQAEVIGFNGASDGDTLATFSNSDITFESVGAQYKPPGLYNDTMLRLGNSGSFTFDVSNPLDIVFNFTTTRNLTNNTDSSRLGEGGFLNHLGDAGDSYLYNNDHLSSVGDFQFCCSVDNMREGFSQLTLQNVTGREFLSFQGGLEQVQFYNKYDNYYGNPFLIPNDIVLLSISYNLRQPTTPVPEPETYALMLAGLGIMGTVSRRKRRSNSEHKQYQGNLA